jgi:hypothetical protein
MCTFFYILLNLNVYFLLDFPLCGHAHSNRDRPSCKVGPEYNTFALNRREQNDPHVHSQCGWHSARRALYLLRLSIVTWRSTPGPALATVRGKTNKTVKLKKGNVAILINISVL